MCLLLGNVTSGFLIEVKALKAELEAKNTELKAMDLGDSPVKHPQSPLRAPIRCTFFRFLMTHRRSGLFLDQSRGEDHVLDVERQAHDQDVGLEEGAGAAPGLVLGGTPAC